MRSRMMTRSLIIVLLLLLVVTSQLRSAIVPANDILVRSNDIGQANGHSPISVHLETQDSGSSNLSPVILVPGDGGSRLQAKLNRVDVAHHYCERKSTDWFDLWLNLSLLVPFALDCWVDNMKLVYNSTTHTSDNAPGVSIRVAGFGTTESVEFVDPAKVMGTGYFDTIVKHLVSLGYQRNVNIFGAPYDFRRAPNELGDYFADLRRLVEAAYTKNGNEPVVFVCHSMGCLNSHYFLRHQTPQWKSKYMRSLISLSGVWAGSVKAMKAFASGDNFGVVVIPSLSLRKDVRTFPSLAYLLPSPDVWPHDKVLLRHKNSSYTVLDYDRFFHDIGHPNGYQMWLDVRNLTAPIQSPGVEVHCLHGHKVNTIELLDYPVGNFPDSARPRLTLGDGDGTVNLISLQTCSNWSNKQSQAVHYKSFKSIDHMTILTDNQVLQYIAEALVKSG